MGHKRKAPPVDVAKSHVVVAPGVSKPDRPPTAYEQRVYEMCKAIPKGKVSTYGEMAKALGSSARAVGQAMRRNPFAPVVPCHRVVAADLNLGGFSGSWGVDCANVQRKKQMLETEGVKFEGHKVGTIGSSVVQPSGYEPFTNTMELYMVDAAKEQAGGWLHWSLNQIMCPTFVVTAGELGQLLEQQAETQ